MIKGIHRYWPLTVVATGTMGLTLASSGTVTTRLLTRTSTSAVAYSSITLLKESVSTCEGKIARAMSVLVAEILRRFMCAEDECHG
jgi:hypothetical protein